MDVDRTPSPTSATPSPARGRRFDRHAAEEDGGGDMTVACTGKSCQSCTAGAIADCVAVCCCPCAVVNILVLAFFKLPYAVARRCIRDRRRRRVLKCRRGGGKDRDINGIQEKEEGKLEIVKEEEVMKVSFSADEIWLEACEVGHLGFGRVSFTGITFKTKGS